MAWVNRCNELGNVIPAASAARRSILPLSAISQSSNMEVWKNWNFIYPSGESGLSVRTKRETSFIIPWMFHAVNWHRITSAALMTVLWSLSSAFVFLQPKRMSRRSRTAVTASPLASASGDSALKFQWGAVLRKNHWETGTLSGLASDKNGSAMVFHYLLADGQTHPGSFILVAAMQSFKGTKNPIPIFFIKTDPLVLEGNFPAPLFTQATINFNFWCTPSSECGPYELKS